MQVRALRNVVNNKPGYSPAQTQLGLLHMQLGDLKTAEKWLVAVVDDEPGNADAVDTDTASAAVTVAGAARRCSLTAPEPSGAPNACD